MRVVFIVPCYNMSDNFEELTSSIISQSDNRWSCIMIDDMSIDTTWEKIEKIQNTTGEFSGIKNNKKKYALRNIVETARCFQDREDIIIATIDGDDSLCNNNTVSLLINQYESGEEVVWTGHRWDINNMNISDRNFKDTWGNWFKRGYDQALMLPILSLTSFRKYIPDICYRYNINSVSIKDRSWEEAGQISTINIVRARGFLLR
mgnify:CR=1 FL=1